MVENVTDSGLKSEQNILVGCLNNSSSVKTSTSQNTLTSEFSCNEVPENEDRSVKCMNETVVDDCSLENCDNIQVTINPSTVKKKKRRSRKKKNSSKKIDQKPDLKNCLVHKQISSKSKTHPTGIKNYGSDDHRIYGLNYGNNQRRMYQSNYKNDQRRMYPSSYESDQCRMYESDYGNDQRRVYPSNYGNDQCRMYGLNYGRDDCRMYPSNYEIDDRSMYPSNDQYGHPNIYGLNYQHDGTGMYQSYNRTQVHSTNYQDDKINLPNYQDDRVHLQNYQDDKVNLQNYQDDRVNSTNYQDDVIHTQNYQDDNINLPNYQDDNMNLPNYQDDKVLSPNYQDDKVLSPNYQDDKLLLSNYQDDNINLPNYQDLLEKLPRRIPLPYVQPNNAQETCLNNFDSSLNDTKSDFMHQANETRIYPKNRTFGLLREEPNSDCFLSHETYDWSMDQDNHSAKMFSDFSNPRHAYYDSTELQKNYGSQWKFTDVFPESGPTKPYIPNFYRDQNFDLHSPGRSSIHHDRNDPNFKEGSIHQPHPARNASYFKEGSIPHSEYVDPYYKEDSIHHSGCGDPRYKEDSIHPARNASYYKEDSIHHSGYGDPHYKEGSIPHSGCGDPHYKKNYIHHSGYGDPHYKEDSIHYSGYGDPHYKEDSIHHSGYGDSHFKERSTHLARNTPHFKQGSPRQPHPARNAPYYRQGPTHLGQRGYLKSSRGSTHQPLFARYGDSHSKQTAIRHSSHNLLSKSEPRSVLFQQKDVSQNLYDGQCNKAIGGPKLNSIVQHQPTEEAKEGGVRKKKKRSRKASNTRDLSIKTCSKKLMEDTPVSMKDSASASADARKIFLKGLPKYFQRKRLKDFLTEQGVMGQRLDYGKRSSFSIVYKTEESMNESLVKIQNMKLQFDKFELTLDSFRPRKRSRTSSERTEVKALTQEDLVERICPLYGTPYEEQLNLKKIDIIAAVRSLKNIIKKEYYGSVSDDSINSWLASVANVVPSPILEMYRNKVELNVQQSNLVDPITIGFRVGKQRDFAPLMLPTEDYIFHPLVRTIAPKLLEVLIESKICGDGIMGNPPDKCWKQISIRTPTTGLNMLTFELAISDFEGGSDSLESLLVNSLTEKLDLEALGIVSVNIKYSRGPKCSADLGLPVIKNLIGLEEIYEDLLGLRFKISAESFFQTNTKGAECLYETIRKIITSAYSATSLESSIVLDICCGTGTIALIMAKLVKCVYGVEICADAVKNAQINANLNEIKNAFFVCGDVTKIVNNDWIAKIFSENSVTEEPLIAILDPPRAGVDLSVIRSLRLCNNVKKILYVACNPAGIMKNIACLTRNKTNSMRGEPFNLVQCIPVDMFPHTKHCEAIFVLDR